MPRSKHAVPCPNPQCSSDLNPNAFNTALRRHIFAPSSAACRAFFRSNDGLECLAEHGLHWCDVEGCGNILCNANGAKHHKKMNGERCEASTSRPQPPRAPRDLSAKLPRHRAPCAETSNSDPNPSSHSQPEPERFTTQELIDSIEQEVLGAPTETETPSSSSQELQVPVQPQLHSTAAPRAKSPILYANSNVPRGSFEAWGKEVEARIDAVLNASSSEDQDAAAKLLFQLPSMLLSDTNSSRRRCQSFSAKLRDLHDGFDITPAAFTAKKSRLSEAAIARRVQSQMINNNLKGAVRDLEPAEIASATPEVRSALQALHPSEEVQVPEPSQTSTQSQIPCQLSMAMKHMLAAIRGHPPAKAAILDLMNAILGGSIPVLELMKDCRLIALHKKGGRGIRPIAIGEVWARLAALCALKACPSLGPDMCPLQVGVGVKGGAQCLGLAIRAGSQALPEEVTLQLDWKNAFNSISRQAILDTIAASHSHLFPFVKWMYATPSRLWLPGSRASDSPLLSTSGVKQGDPIGPLLFSLTLQPLLQKISAEFPGVRVAAYLDDTFLQGPPALVANAFSRLQSLGAAIHLKVVPDKSAIYSPTSASLAEISSLLPDIKDLSSEGLVVAGCPVGSPRFESDACKDAADRVCDLVDKLIQLDIPTQSQFLILTKSLQRKLNHLARCVPLDSFAPHLQFAQDKIWTAFLSCIRCSDSDVDKHQCTLPLRMGGVGLSDLLAENGMISKAAFTSGCAQAHAAFEDGPAAFDTLSGPCGALLDTYWQDIAAFCVCASSPCTCKANLQQAPPPDASAPGPSSSAGAAPASRPMPRDDIPYLSAMQSVMSQAP